MYPGGQVLAGIVLRTTLVYGVVLLGMRLSGKREVGQMTPFDLTLLLLLSNAVQNAMTGPDTSVLGGIVAASTLLLLNYLIAELSGGKPALPKIGPGPAQFAGARWQDHRRPHGPGARQHGRVAPGFAGAWNLGRERTGACSA